MSEARAHWDERTFEGAFAEASTGLAPGERAELLARIDARDFEQLELALAELNLAGLGRLEPMPRRLLERVRADAAAHFDSQRSQPRPAPTPSAAPRRVPAKLVSMAGWLVAAGVLAFFALRERLERAPSPEARREQLIAQASDLVRAGWTATPDPLAGGVSGDVVWSRARQEGYMRLRGLPSNDPRRQQYQLWVFDKTRAEWEAKPVDGGVFDIAPGAEVVVPMAAKLEVREAAFFAVTLEEPGGAVVSKREHLLATASP